MVAKGRLTMMIRGFSTDLSVMATTRKEMKTAARIA